MSHTPTPWEARECGDFGGWGIIAVEPMRGRVDSQITGMTEANARLIVRAVNAFEPMRKALEDALKTTYQMEQKMGAEGNLAAMKLYTEKYKSIKAALALADREKP